MLFIMDLSEQFNKTTSQTSVKGQQILFAFFNSFKASLHTLFFSYTRPYYGSYYF